VNQASRDHLNPALHLVAEDFLKDNKLVVERLGQCLRQTVKGLTISAAASDYFARQCAPEREPDTLIQVLVEGRALLWFTVSPYNYCCAMNQINGFGYDNCLEFEFVDAMMATLQKSVRRYSSQRWVFNFVETRRDRDHPVDATEVVLPEVEREPRMHFEYLYDWAKRQAKFQEMLFVNQNTGNIIHFCEVVFHE